MTGLEEYFHLVNGRYFRCKLKRVEVRWKYGILKKRGVFGTTWSEHGNVPKGTRKFLIEIDAGFRRMEKVALMTLIHEMVHVEQWDKIGRRDHHGHLFQKRMKQLAAKGALNGLW